MRRLGGVDDFPIVLLEHLTLILRQTALRVVQDQPGAQRREGGVDMDRVRIARKVDRMHPVVGEMPPQPLDALQVGRKPMLDHQIAAKPQDVRSVKQGLFLGGDTAAHCRRFSTPILSLR